MRGMTTEELIVFIILLHYNSFIIVFISTSIFGLFCCNIFVDHIYIKTNHVIALWGFGCLRRWAFKLGCKKASILSQLTSLTHIQNTIDRCNRPMECHFLIHLRKTYVYPKTKRKTRQRERERERFWSKEIIFRLHQLILLQSQEYTLSSRLQIHTHSSEYNFIGSVLSLFRNQGKWFTGKRTILFCTDYWYDKSHYSSQIQEANLLAMLQQSSFTAWKPLSSRETVLSCFSRASSVAWSNSDLDLNKKYPPHSQAERIEFVDVCSCIK